MRMSVCFFVISILCLHVFAFVNKAVANTSSNANNCFIDTGGCNAVATTMPVGKVLSIAPVASQTFVFGYSDENRSVETYLLFHHDQKGLRLGFTQGSGPDLSLVNVKAVLSHLNRYCYLSIVSPVTNAWHLTSRFRVTDEGQIWANPINLTEQYANLTMFSDHALLDDTFKSLRFNQHKFQIFVKFADDGQYAKGQRPFVDYFDNCRGML